MRESLFVNQLNKMFKIQNKLTTKKIKLAK